MGLLFVPLRRHLVGFCPSDIAKTHFDAFLLNDSVVKVHVACRFYLWVQHRKLPFFLYGIFLTDRTIQYFICYNNVPYLKMMQISENNVVLHRFLRICLSNQNYKEWCDVLILVLKYYLPQKKKSTFPPSISKSSNAKDGNLKKLK